MVTNVWHNPFCQYATVEETAEYIDRDKSMIYPLTEDKGGKVLKKQEDYFFADDALCEELKRQKRIYRKSKKEKGNIMITRKGKDKLIEYFNGYSRRDKRSDKQQQNTSSQEQQKSDQQNQYDQEEVDAILKDLQSSPTIKRCQYERLSRYIETASESLDKNMEEITKLRKRYLDVMIVLQTKRIVD